MLEQATKTNETKQSKNRKNADASKAGLPSRTLVHAKLEMTTPGDADEREADLMARDIISGGKIRRQVSNGFSGGSGVAIPSQMEGQLSQLQGGGHAMPDGLRSMMESGFGRDFSQVRLHTDTQAADLSSSIHAKAFTHGNDIYFNRGQFSPTSTDGQRLVAHELTHVAQGSGKVGRYGGGEEILWDQIDITYGFKNISDGLQSKIKDLRYITSPVNARIEDLFMDLVFHNGEDTLHSINKAYDLASLIMSRNGAAEKADSALDVRNYLDVLEVEKETQEVIIPFIDLLTDVDSIISCIITGYEFNTVLQKANLKATALSKQLEGIVSASSSIEAFEKNKSFIKIFNKFDTICSIWCILSGIHKIINGAEKISNGTSTLESNYTLFAIDIPTLAADIITFPPLEKKLSRWPALVIVAEEWSAIVYGSDLIIQITKHPELLGKAKDLAIKKFNKLFVPASGSPPTN